MHVLTITAVAAFSAVIVSCNKSKELEGCTSYTAVNYNPYATIDDGSCVYDTVDPNNNPLPPVQGNFDMDLGTSWSGDWNDWEITINGVQGSISTTWSDNWNDWDFSMDGVTGTISTDWTDNWNDWDLASSGITIQISTTWTNNWNDWDIDHNAASWSVDVSSTWTDNWNDWDIQGDSVNADISTSWSNDWDDWNSDGTFGQTLPAQYKVAVIFVPVIIAVLKAEGVIP